MGSGKEVKDSVSYVVGEERGILDILRIEDVRPLLRGAVQAGASEAALQLDDGSPVCSEISRRAMPADMRQISTPLRLEGEPVGRIVLTGDGTDPSLDGVAAMLSRAMDVVLANNLKRMLTTEMHTSVVTQTYDELLLKHQALEASEAKYRELAAQLEVKVQERTAELAAAHTRLLQQEKMASVGQLAAGVAHEINNPMGFITSNLGTLQRYVAKFVAMLDWYEAGIMSGTDTARLAEAAGRKKQELKLQLVRDDIDDLLGQSLAGAERVRKIVADLKGFSHVDDTALHSFDLNAEIERTLAVMAQQLPPDMLVIRDLAPVPAVRGNGALFCQALANLIQNACQARPSGLVLTLRSENRDDAVELSIADNGSGIPEGIRNRIFEPFFTTRAVGSGTGMGLAVVYDVVTGFGGSILLDAAAEGGARFVLRLPLNLKEGC